MSKTKFFILILFIIAACYSFIHFNDSKEATLDKIYVMNLDRSPERYKAIQKKLNNMSFPVSYDRFSAIDGRKISFTNKLTGEVLLGQEILDKKIWLKGDFDARCEGTNDPADLVLITNLNEIAFNSRVGCTCSHKKIWQDMVEKDYQNALIIEDDIKFMPYFNILLNLSMKNSPKDYELLFLNYKAYGKAFENNNFTTFIKNPFWKIVKKHIYSSQAYILTNEGAKKLLKCEQKVLSKEYKAIDIIMHDCIEDELIKTYASNPKLSRPDHSTNNLSDIDKLNR